MCDERVLYNRIYIYIRSDGVPVEIFGILRGILTCFLSHGYIYIYKHVWEVVAPFSDMARDRRNFPFLFFLNARVYILLLRMNLVAFVRKIVRKLRANFGNYSMLVTRVLESRGKTVQSRVFFQITFYALRTKTNTLTIVFTLVYVLFVVPAKTEFVWNLCKIYRKTFASFNFLKSSLFDFLTTIK